MRHSDQAVAEIYNNIEIYPSLMSVAEHLSVSYQDIKSWADRIRRKLARGEEAPEIISRSARSTATGLKQRVVEEIQDIAREVSPRRISAKDLRHIPTGDIQLAAGTTHELKRLAGLDQSRGSRRVELDAARHASLDHLDELNHVRQGYESKYLRDRSGRFKTIIGCNDLHDKEIDEFWLRVFLDTCKRIQPDVIVLNGDIFDLPEFGKYTVDPRVWDAAGRIRFAHERILKPLREACPDAQIDFLEGNHEYRLVRLLGEAAPGLQALLADIHGWDVAKLFGLDRFEINYVAKGDLKTFTKADASRELAKNYKVYYGAVLAHHFPDAKSLGLPGWNGHHHSHNVVQYFSPNYGAYEWHQFGCGHRREASYCLGEKWGMGFGIINVDTQTLAVNTDYVQVTEFAVSGGKWYYREESERYSDPPLLSPRK